MTPILYYFHIYGVHVLFYHNKIIYITFIEHNMLYVYLPPDSWSFWSLRLSPRMASMVWCLGAGTDVAAFAIIGL